MTLREMLRIAAEIKEEMELDTIIDAGQPVVGTDRYDEIDSMA